MEIDNNQTQEMNKNTKALLAIIIVFCTAVTVMLLSGLILNKKVSYEYIFLGDSIFGNVRDDSSIPALVASELGVSYLNGGLGGTTATMKNSSFPEAMEYSASLYAITDAVVNNDFSYVLASQPVRADGDLSYFEDTVKKISKADFSRAKVIIIEHGLNDYFAGIPAIDISENDMSYFEALYSSVSMLKIKYPDTRIILVTPVSSEYSVSIYADAMIQVAKDTGAEVLDMYSQGVVTMDNVSTATIDGIHLSEEGRRQYARILTDYINEQ